MHLEKLKAEIRRTEAGGQTRPAPAEEILTKRELAAKFKVTVRTIEHWASDEFLPFFRISTVVRFYWPAVVEFLLKNSSGQRPEAERDCGTTDRGPQKTATGGQR
jgi:hypothetical protein